MPLTDDRTAHLDLPLPHQFNDLPDDAERLRVALTALDSKAESDDEFHQLVSDDIAKLNGGTINQVLRKSSNTNLDMEWADPMAAVQVIVVSREETQTLAASQVIIDLVDITTDGCAVYIEGIRLLKSQFTINTLTRLTLAASYPVGTTITVVQNEETGDYPQATEVQKGIAEVATNAEVATGTDDTRMLTPLKLAVVIAQLARLSQSAHGQCRLLYVSATALKLSPFNGNNLLIDGVPRLIPSAGVSLSNSGLSASTLYFVYAYMVGSTVTLEAVTTAHAQDANTGVEIKSGASGETRTLVGMTYTNASSQFADSVTSRLVASYFNRRTRNAGLFNTTGINYTNTVAAEISATLRVQFITWGDETVRVSSSGQYSAGLNQSIACQAMVDSTAYGSPCADFSNASASGMSYASIGSGTLPANTPLAEGHHLATMFGSVTGSTGTLQWVNTAIDLRI